MTNPLPSLEAQAARYRELSESSRARRIRLQLESLVCEARAHGLRVEVTQVSVGQRMGCTTEVVSVVPSRSGYQSASIEDREWTPAIPGTRPPSEDGLYEARYEGGSIIIIRAEGGKWMGHEIIADPTVSNYVKSVLFGQKITCFRKAKPLN